MKYIFKISLLATIAYLYIHEVPLLSYDLSKNERPSAEEIIEWAKTNNVSELTKLIESEQELQMKEDYPSILWYTAPIQEENVTGINFVSILDYDRSIIFPNTERIVLGPRYSVIDLVAKFGTPETMRKLLNISEKWWFHVPYSSRLKINALSVDAISDINKKLASNGEIEGIADVIRNKEQRSNPLANAAISGRLDMVKEMVEWFKENEDVKKIIPVSNINPPVADFISPGIFLFGGNPLIATLLKWHITKQDIYKQIAQYLIDQGASLLGSTRKSQDAYLIRFTKNDIAPKLERINVNQLVQDALSKFRNLNLESAINNGDLNAVQYLIEHNPTLINNYHLKESSIGRNLAIAQFIHSEMKKQKIPFTGLIFTSWLNGAAHADAEDVVKWLLETIAQFDVKPMIRIILNESNIVPGGKVETYLKKTRLLDTRTREVAKEVYHIDETHKD